MVESGERKRGPTASEIEQNLADGLKKSGDTEAAERAAARAQVMKANEKKSPQFAPPELTGAGDGQFFERPERLLQYAPENLTGDGGGRGF
jgi:hypothetical protein